MNGRLSKDLRLRKNPEFVYLFKNGRKWKGEWVNLWVIRSPEQPPAGEGSAKFGIVVSRKTHPRATRRNLWKRRIRESYRQHRARIKKGIWVVVQAKLSASQAGERKKDDVPSLKELDRDMKGLFARAGITLEKN
ncbi:MAG: ribonuclease P protein component [Omnitrophica bacterium GWA2_52_8]|nr:MAG: ribonuclease P protein component [Omnitrophica bacterium GWA2_52_8]